MLTGDDLPLSQRTLCAPWWRSGVAACRSVMGLGAGRKPVRDRLRAGLHAELGVDAPHVVLHCLLRKEQMRGDLAVCAAAGDQRHDLALASRQPGAVLATQFVV